MPIVSLVAQMVKNLPAMQETQVQSQKDRLEKGMVTHSSILAWRIPWTDEPDRHKNTKVANTQKAVFIPSVPPT